MLLDCVVNSQVNPTVYWSALWWVVTVLHISFSFKLFALFPCFSSISCFFLLKWWNCTHLMMNVSMVTCLIWCNTPDFHDSHAMLCVSIVLTYLSHTFAIFSDLTLQRDILKNVLTAHGVMNMYGKWPIRKASFLYFLLMWIFWNFGYISNMAILRDGEWKIYYVHQNN
jgi:hypothetical protein